MDESRKSSTFIITTGIMKKILRYTAMVIIAMTATMKAGAQSIDPTLAGLIAVYTERMGNSLEPQNKIMLLESTGHIFIEEEVDATYQIQKEFNEYLDSFRGVLVFAAQIYGFYYEIDRMVGYMDSLTKQIGEAPMNALAVALSTNRNKIYREIILQSVEIVNDIRLVCFDGGKMTEKERIEVLFGIRPKLQLYNKKLLRLAKAVKYTTMGDVWNEITGRPSARADKASITTEAFLRWKRLGRTVRP